MAPPAARRATILVALSGAALALLATIAAPGRGQPSAVATGTGIVDIEQFLDQCPNNDPFYTQLRADFEIRREGVLVGGIPCTEPVSMMPLAQYTDELIAVQVLRVIYYIEGGRTVPYPWTSGSMYDWMKSKIGGIDIRDNGSYCCEMYNGEWSAVIGAQGSLDRDGDREWRGLSEQVTLLAHETRHVQGFPHVGFCPLFPTQPYGCDQTYDEASLAPYAIEWWLNAKWLSGEVRSGLACLSESDLLFTAGSLLSNANNDFRRRFVDVAPPLLSMPAQPGGVCSASTPAPTQTVAPTATATPPTSTPTPPPTASATATPTVAPTPTLAPTPTPALTPRPLVQGDVDCSGSVSSADALKIIRFVAQLVVAQNQPCPAMGDAAAWGDVDCDGSVSSIDALKVLRHVAALSVPQPLSCAPVGSALP